MAVRYASLTHPTVCAFLIKMCQSIVFANLEYIPMPNYRRLFVPGGTWFFTVNLQDRRQKLLTENVDLLRAAFSHTKKQWPFRIDAIVILPDHLHAILTLPNEDTDFSLRWRLIKSYFSKGIKSDVTPSWSKTKRKERGIWQRRFWEHYIRDEEDYQFHKEYCYINPMKHRLVSRVKDWPYSSFHQDVADGLVHEDWAGDISGIKFLGEAES